MKYTPEQQLVAIKAAGEDGYTLCHTKSDGEWQIITIHKVNSDIYPHPPTFDACVEELCRKYAAKTIPEVIMSFIEKQVKAAEDIKEAAKKFTTPHPTCADCANFAAKPTDPLAGWKVAIERCRREFLPTEKNRSTYRNNNNPCDCPHVKDGCGLAGIRGSYPCNWSSISDLPVDSEGKPYLTYEAWLADHPQLRSLTVEEMGYAKGQCDDRNADPRCIDRCLIAKRNRITDCYKCPLRDTVGHFPCNPDWNPDTVRVPLDFKVVE